MNRANLPTNANASTCRCGNARPHTHKREYYQHPQSPGVSVRSRASRQRSSAAARAARAARTRNTRGAAQVAPVYPNPAVGYNYADPVLPGQPGGPMVPIPGEAPPNSCMFPAPAPQRIYCMPAAFTQVNGQTYEPLMMAYGYSKPMQPGY